MAAHLIYSEKVWIREDCGFLNAGCGDVEMKKVLIVWDIAGRCNPRDVIEKAFVNVLTRDG